MTIIYCANHIYQPHNFNLSALCMAHNLVGYYSTEMTASLRNTRLNQVSGKGTCSRFSRNTWRFLVTAPEVTVILCTSQMTRFASRKLWGNRKLLLMAHTHGVWARPNTRDARGNADTREATRVLARNKNFTFPYTAHIPFMHKYQVRKISCLLGTF